MEEERIPDDVDDVMEKEEKKTKNPFYKISKRKRGKKLEQKLKEKKEREG